ncbi:hypothetical protein BH23PSE2_BH23PSE2_12730 [soil metagenome]
MSDSKPRLRRPDLLVSGTCVLALATVLLPAPAPAQVVASGDYLARMDADGDGRVSLAEYQDWLSYGFDAMDRNRDGVLTPDELPGGRGTPVTRGEHRARLADAFRRQDRNGDGFLDARELAAPPR